MCEQAKERERELYAVTRGLSSRCAEFRKIPQTDPPRFRDIFASNSERSALDAEVCAGLCSANDRADGAFRRGSRAIWICFALGNILAVHWRARTLKMFLTPLRAFPSRRIASLWNVTLTFLQEIEKFDRIDRLNAPLIYVHRTPMIIYSPVQKCIGAT